MNAALPIIAVLAFAGFMLAGKKKKGGSGRSASPDIGPPVPPIPPGVTEKPKPGKRPNVAAARNLAPLVADDIRTNLGNYDIELLKKFQAAAAIAVDGIYGKESAAALKRYGVTNPPIPMRRFRDVINEGGRMSTSQGRR